MGEPKNIRTGRPILKHPMMKNPKLTTGYLRDDIPQYLQKPNGFLRMMSDGQSEGIKNM